MDNFRLILFFALAFVLLLIYQAWMEDYGPRPQVVAEQAPSAADPGVASVPATLGGVPDANVLQPAGTVPDPSIEGTAPSTGEVIRVETDVVRVNISTKGGTISSMRLLNYPVDKKVPDIKVQLMKPERPNLYLSQSGLIGADKELAPTHEAMFTAGKQSYELEEGADTLTVELQWIHESGIQVTKRYIFKRGSYLIDVQQEVVNDSQANWAARAYTQLQRSEFYDPNQQSFIYTYTGAAYYTPEDKYDKVTFDDISQQKLSREVQDGWIGMLQHYFLSAWVPPRGELQTLYTNSLPGPRYVAGIYTESVTVPQGSSHTFNSQFYAGPKLQENLAQIAEGLDLAVDYGWLTILAQPIFWLLNKLHSMVNNWGVAIILLTILIKLAFYKLSETSYKSMANMRKMTPRIQALKDRYGDDKEKMNQAMMEMYKKEKINPLGGCLPILVQIPVFIALYWVLLESVEMRQAPFALWLNNLSEPDPYFVLPLIMGVSMFIQQKLNPAPVDPLQAKIMMSLPLVFTVFFAFFPSGLVLYWVVNNILSIAQQWYITQNIEKAAKTK